MYTRFLFFRHQPRRSSEKAYISLVSRNRLTSVSNSVREGGANGMGFPQLGFPRRRHRIGRWASVAMAPHDTLAHLLLRCAIWARVVGPLSPLSERRRKG